MFKQISYEERLKIEVLYNTKHSKKYIAAVLGRHISTIYREIEKGLYSHTLTDLREEIRYSAQIAQNKADYNATAKGRDLKIGSDFDFADFVEDCILNKGWSPDQITGFIRLHNISLTHVCTSTLYSYIARGVFLNISNKNLLYKGQRKTREYKQVRRTNLPKGPSIEERPFKFSARTFGHWEMDTVIGKRDTRNALLVLTERYSCFEMIFRIKHKSASEVVRILNHLEWKFGKDFKEVFKTVTVDNGSEFSAYEFMSKSYRGKKPRTEIYYCHPYSAWERGSNEKQNQIIRRYIAKGEPIEKYTDEFITEVQNKINNLPRRIFGYYSAAQIFDEEIKRLRAKDYCS